MILVFLSRIYRTLPPRVWAIISSALLVVFFISWVYLQGRESERARQASQNQRAQAEASADRETAANERNLEGAAISARQKERDQDAQALPDGVPDNRELRRRCRQLRDAGSNPAACRELAG